eukprot:CAMPEP_0194135676 /NCGR_PEP_ID=MMETSP0152-20130528/5768_1 /TAXON_ID=1049557 /ORGANISM="Thalassiothrix antarctica, Strain L6-D1" /LENGTH=199 /DNA_ID=CAMNT_0038832019 /DNA_START=72 /DNA_END=674 /DNA_ORIENTATION=-
MTMLILRSFALCTVLWFSHFPYENEAFTATSGVTTIIQQSSLLFSTQTGQQQQEASQQQERRYVDENVILYDGVCNFCNTWVDILLRVDIQEKFKFAPLQSDVGKELLVAIGKEADDISSVVLVPAGATDGFDKSRCVLKVVEELGPLAKIASQGALAIVPEEIRDTIYDTVAENRYNFMGKRDECRCTDPKYSKRFLL